MKWKLRTLYHYKQVIIITVVEPNSAEKKPDLDPTFEEKEISQ